MITKFIHKVIATEAANAVVLQKKWSLKISKNSQENTCARVFNFIKIETLE